MTRNSQPLPPRGEGSYAAHDDKNNDPTTLTTDALRREIAGIDRELTQRRETQLKDMDSLKVLLETEIQQARAVSLEQLHSIQTQFELIEKQRVEQKKDTKDAVDAALIAQKEAVQEQTIASGLSIAKSEAATAKQLDQLAVTFSTAITGVNQTLTDMKDQWNRDQGDMKDRVAKIESSIVNLQGQKKGGDDTRAAMYAIIGCLASIAIIVSVLFATGTIN